MNTHFFERYGKIINAQSLLNRSKQLGKVGEIDYPFKHDSTLRRKISGTLDNLTVGELNDLSYTLKQAGITGGKRSLSGQTIYKDLDIIKIKTFMEFAFLSPKIWKKIREGTQLSDAEKKERQKVKKMVQRIYDGGELDASQRKTLAEAMNQIANDL